MVSAVHYVIMQAERKIPMNYANRYRNSALAQQSYLPFKDAPLAPVSARMQYVREVP